MSDRLRRVFEWEWSALARRFWSKVDRNGPTQPHCPDLGPCWLWTGMRHPRGYGEIKVLAGRLKAHRVAYELEREQVPDGLCVCHRCDNPPCVNPSHLFLGTLADNNHDRHRKGRTARGAKTRNRRALASRRQERSA